MFAKREEIWRSIIQESVSGKETKLVLWSWPRHRWTLDISLLREYSSFAEYNAFMAFFNLMSGAGVNFVYGDPNDSSYTGMASGTTDGANSVYQLTRAILGAGYSYIEPIQTFNGTPSVYLAGVLQSGYTIDQFGQVHFATLPATGQAITWTGSIYFLSRFVKDSLSFDQFAVGPVGTGVFAEVKSVSWISVKL
jgi:uncharacterized protein (TIGR02217 family)